jgi:hypothetical protein
MRKNVGKIDRILRGAAAILIILLFLTKAIEGQTAIIFGIVAIAMVVTSLTSFCPCYARLNINTSAKNNKTEN